jgi:hypothetical protein
VLSLIQRSDALLSAVAGPDCDLDRARTSAEQGLALARAAGRRRTMLHCELVLEAARNRPPLAAFPT